MTEKGEGEVGAVWSTTFGKARIGAATMLVLALAPWPYAYYQLLRLLVCGTAAYGAYEAWSRERRGWLWTFGAVAVLFNPVLPITMSRGAWAVFDLGTAVLLTVSLWRFAGAASER